jgi:RNA polymerase sigma factor (sigma-70 family)
MANASMKAVVRDLRQRALADRSAGRTDHELLLGFSAGNDQAAFAALVRRHGGMVLRVCRHVLGHEQDAEDAFQATFLVLARKGGSIRKRESLASWLHGVAYRTAMSAKRDAGRRRMHERQAPSSPSRDPSEEVTWREVQAGLDEEIQRLPERLRAPFILCVLEGKKTTEAARELGLKEGTVWSRLAQARKQLRERLGRRGLSLPLVLAGAVLSGGVSSAGVPVSLVNATVKAVPRPSAGGVSAKVHALAEEVSKTMSATKMKLGIVCLAAVGMLALGAGVLMRGEAGAQPLRAGSVSDGGIPREPPKPAPGPREPSPPKKEAAREVKKDAVTVRARVLDPDGKPVAGADVTLWWHLGYWGYYKSWHPRVSGLPTPRSVGKSGPDGRIHFTFSPSEIKESPTSIFNDPWRFTQVVAAAKGYGPAWASLESLGKGELTLRLVRDDVPVKGRVLDLQGRPVEGTRIRLDYIHRGKDYGDQLWQNAWTGLSKDVKTDKEGRFTLTGVGRDRVVVLHVEGPTIEHKVVKVRTRAGEAQVEVIAGPTKPIEGTVRAKDTGKPLAGVVIYGGEEAHHRGVRAVTDKHGRYRLVGLSKASRYEVKVYLPGDLPYLGTLARLEDSEGLKPIKADFELRRGVEVRFRLIDKQTGKPVRASVQYTPLQSNPFYREAELHPGWIPTRVWRRIHTADQDGVFHLVAYPGPGLITALVQGTGAYLPARISAADRKKASGDPMLGFAEISQGYRVIDTTKTDKPLAFDIELDTGRKLKGTLLGPDGKPVTGATAHGLNYHPMNRRNAAYLPSYDDRLLKKAAFTVLRLQAGTPRTVSFVHKERKLVGHVVLSGKEKGRIKVRLQPWGVVTGRFVDADGKPLPADTRIRVEWRYRSLPAPGMRPADPLATTDAEGRFRLEGLLPGPKFGLVLTPGKAKGKGEGPGKVQVSSPDALKGLSLDPGEVKDLGDIRVSLMK